MAYDFKALKKEIAAMNSRQNPQRTEFFEKAHARMKQEGFDLIDYTTEDPVGRDGRVKSESSAERQARQSHSLEGKGARDVTEQNNKKLADIGKDARRYQVLEGTQSHYQHPETGSVVSIGVNGEGYEDVSESRMSLEGEAATRDGQIKGQYKPSREALGNTLDKMKKEKEEERQWSQERTTETQEKINQSKAAPRKSPERAFGNESEAEDFIRNQATQEEVQQYVESGGSRGQLGQDVLKSKFGWQEEETNYGRKKILSDHKTRAYISRGSADKGGNHFANEGDARALRPSGLRQNDTLATDIPFSLDLESQAARGYDRDAKTYSQLHDAAEKSEGGFLNDPAYGKTTAAKEKLLERGEGDFADQLVDDPSFKERHLDQVYPPKPAPPPPAPVAAPPPKPAPAVSPAEVKAQPAATPAPRPTLYHGGRSGMSLDDIQIVREAGATKQGKKGRVYGGFYTTANIEEAEGYAKMAGEGNSVYQVDLRPDAVIEDYEGEVSRFSPKQIEEFRARNVDAVVGKDVRGRTEHVIFNKDAVVGLTDVSGNPQPGALPSSTSPEPKPPAKLAQGAEEVAQATANSEPIPQPAITQDPPSVAAKPEPEPIRIPTQEEMDARAEADKARSAPGVYHEDAPAPEQRRPATVDLSPVDVEDQASSASKNEFRLPPDFSGSTGPKPADGGSANSPPPKPKGPRFKVEDSENPVKPGGRLLNASRAVREVGVGNAFIEGELELTTRGLAGGMSSVINEWGYNRRERVGGGTIDTKWGREWVPGGTGKYAAPEIAKNGGHSAWKTVASERQLHESWDEYIMKSKGFGTGARRQMYKFLGGKESSVNKWLAKVGGAGTIFPTAMAVYFAGKDAMEGYQKDGLVGGIRGAVGGYIQMAITNRVLGAALMNPIRGAIGAGALVTAGYISHKIFDVRNQGNQYLKSKKSEKTSWTRGVSSFSGTIPATMRGRSLKAMEDSRFGSLKSLGSESSMLMSPRARYSNTTKPWGSRQMLSF